MTLVSVDDSAGKKNKPLDLGGNRGHAPTHSVRNIRMTGGDPVDSEWIEGELDLPS